MKKKEYLMKDIDSQIKKDLSADLPLPDSFTNMVRNTLNCEKLKKQKKTRQIIKTIATACACLLITTSIVFAKEITRFMNEFWKENKGMDTAVENGYIHELDMKYEESNGTRIKVNQFLIDDNNVCLDFSIKLKEGINHNDIQKIDLLDMIITDEEQRILYCQDKNTFEKYCQTNNLDNVWKQESDTNINSGCNWFIESKDEENIHLIYNLYANQFPKSKKIAIDMSKMILYLQENKSEENITLTGDWKLMIDVPKDFYQREKTVYHVKQCSNPKIKVTKVVVSETNTKLEMEIEQKAELPYEMTDDENTKERKINEYIERQNQETFEDYMNRRIVKDEYIENERGEKFYLTNSADENTGNANNEWENNNTEKLTYWQTFTLTEYDITNELKIHLNYQGEEIIIELVKV